jgi:hypothetical protein
MSTTTTSVLVFLCEVAACVSVSLLILARLQRMLRRVGNACEQGGASTEFWVAYTQLMMIVAPVLLVAFFSKAGTSYLSAVDQLKSSFSVVLWGQFLGLILVGRAVWNMIKAPAPLVAPARPAAQLATASTFDIPKPEAP